MLLKDKVAIVTGGTRGIGAGIVRKYLENGAKVAFCGSKKESIEAASDKLRVDFPDEDFMGICPKLTDFDSVREEFSKVVDRFGTIDILVNNAGTSSRSTLYEYTVDEFENIINTNFISMFVCSKAAATVMRANGGGVILNTSSMTSIYGQAKGSAYPSSKAAVSAFTKSLGIELAKDKIRVCAVAPGIIKTDLMEGVPESVIKPLVDRIPLGRIGLPEDVANAFLFLASDLASYITATVLFVDGAATN